MPIFISDSTRAQKLSEPSATETQCEWIEESWYEVKRYILTPTNLEMMELEAWIGYKIWPISPGTWS